MKKRRIILFLFVIILVLVGVIFMFNKGKNDEENEVMIRYVSMNEITEIMEQNEDYIILDVRTLEEYNLGHIPNAICIPNETIDENVVNELPDKNQLILIYCRSGNRSKQATKKLEKLGYTNLVEFGGIMDWNGKLEQ
ncbi:MAG: rhodanese-like domain-containing protein [Clostridia bacterium]|nr:rhodanese-like domain-containing protein [Clostridia bacterium]